MNWDIVKGTWKQLKGKAREEWGDLTDNEYEEIAGNKDQLVGKLQEKYGDRGLQLVGIAIDRLEKVRPYAAEMGMNFPVLLGTSDGLALSRELGNKAGVLPYSIVLDRNGKIVAREVGALKEPKIEALISQLL